MLLRAWLEAMARLRESRDERGATAVEYGIMLALIAAVILVIVTVVGEKTSNSFESVNQLWNP